MSRLPRRLVRELTQIAERARPSATAWWSIQSRIDGPTARAEGDVIVLAADEATASRWPWLLATTATAVVALLVAVAALRRRHRAVRSG